MEEEKHALRVSELAAEYFERQILNRWKHPDILRRRIDKDINPAIGRLRIEEVKARHIDDMLQKSLSVVHLQSLTMYSDGLAVFSITE